MMSNTVNTLEEKEAIVNKRTKISHALALHDQFIEYFAKRSFLQLNNGKCGYVADAIAEAFDKIGVPYEIAVTVYKDDERLIQNCVEDWKSIQKLPQSERDKLNILPACTIHHIYVKLQDGTLLDCYNQIDDELKTEMIDDYGYVVVDIPRELFNEWLVKLNWNSSTPFSTDDLEEYIYIPTYMMTKEFIKNQENQ